MSQTPAPIGSLWAINSTPHNGTATSREAAKNAARAGLFAALDELEKGE